MSSGSLRTPGDCEESLGSFGEDILIGSSDRDVEFSEDADERKLVSCEKDKGFH